jgi:hypothetical protein
MSIPKIIHQTLPSKQTIHPAFQDNISKLKRLNPSWEHRLYEHEDMPLFILNHYGQDILDCFNMIDPRYGAARADFFRYLLMYVEGGVYLDIKSTLTRALDEVLEDEDHYILSHWPHQSDWANASCQRTPELRPDGEYQIWHIICAPRHPFLAAVIDSVKCRIETYDIAVTGVGADGGVLKLTGPDAYTLAIKPIQDNYPHRLVDIRELGLLQSIFEGYGHTDKLGVHYSLVAIPIVNVDDRRGGEKLIRSAAERLHGTAPPILAPAFMARLKNSEARIMTFHGTAFVYLFQIDTCIHDHREPSALQAQVRFHLVGDRISFFVEIAGWRVSLGLNARGFLGSQFELDSREQLPTFRIKPQTDGTFTIGKSDRLLCAEPNGKLVCDRTVAKRWECFHVA